MKWPWVSRFAYDLLLQSVERLEAQNSQLIESLTRKSRFEAGMTETPRPPSKPREPMPDLLREHLAGGSDSSMRRMRRTELEKRHSRGESWDTIIEDVLGAIDGPSPTEELYAETAK